MKRTNNLKPNLILGLLLVCCVSIISAQQTQNVLKERFNVNEDVTIKVDTRYTNIVFETWNKDEVSVEAIVETTEDISKEDAASIAESWTVDASGNSSEISISSCGSLSWNGDMHIDLSALETLKDIPINLDFIGPMVQGLVVPLTEELVVDLPKNFYENMGGLNFDYDAYKKDPDAYMETYEVKMKERFGDDFEIDMKEWGENFGKKMQDWEKSFGKDMEKWTDEHGEDLEKWSKDFEEEYGPKLQAWAEEIAKQYNGEYVTTKTISEDGKKETKVIKYNTVKSGNFTNDNVKRTIIIKMPKDAKLRLDVRHGEIKLAELSRNIQATLSHTTLAANIIDGGQTSIYAAYSPVLVKQWNYGTLNTNYVKECVIDNAKNIKIIAKSSDIVIKNLEDIGVISGTFSRIAIPELAETVTNLDIVLKNSDFIITVPKQAYNFTFNGTRSGLKYPKSLQTQTVKNAGTDRVIGFYKSRNTPTNFAVTASYSNVILK